MLLAIDTATKLTGVALHDGAQVLAEFLWRSHEHHTVELAPEIALLVRRTGVSLADLTAIAVALGPGSYTGLRIGMALAKGLALPHNLSLVGVPTLDILARAQPAWSGPMLALLRAGRRRFAGAWYRHTKGTWQRKGRLLSMAWQEVIDGLKDPTYVCGEMNAKQREDLRREELVNLASPALCVRRPSVLADIAWESVRKGKTADPSALAPIYLGTLSGKRA